MVRYFIETQNGQILETLTIDFFFLNEYRESSKHTLDEMVNGYFTFNRMKKSVFGSYNHRFLTKNGRHIPLEDIVQLWKEEWINEN